QFLDLDVAEVDLGPLGLEADRPFGQVALARIDLAAVDLGDDVAVLEGGFGGVPFTDGLPGLLERLAIKLARGLGAADRDDLAVVAVHALHLDALGPDLRLALDVNEQAAVAEELLLVLHLVRPLVAPVVADDVVLEALLRVKIAVRFTRADKHAVLDGPDVL